MLVDGGEEEDDVMNMTILIIIIIMRIELSLQKKRASYAAVTTHY